jgi:hypothetical protein
MNYTSKWMSPINLFTAIALICLAGGCDGVVNQSPLSYPAANERPDCNSCNILFIGSSYLSYLGNDVVEIFTQFTLTSRKNAYVHKRSVGGYRLDDHLESKETLEIVKGRDWDYIILQGNAAFMSQEKWHHYVVPYLIEWRKVIKEQNRNTCVIYMLPWAYLDGLAWMPGEPDTYWQMQENLLRHTTRVVHEIDIATAPVGWVWYRTWLDRYFITLYLNDDNHQAKSGAYLAAAAFYSTVFLEKAPQIYFRWDENVDTEYLHDLAYSTVVDSLAKWNIY